MKQFADRLKDNWTIDLTVGCLRRVKGLIGVDLTGPEAPVDAEGKPSDDSRVSLAQAIAGNLMLFVDILFAALSDQAKERAVTVDLFCDRLPPDLCRMARQSFMEEWESFFHQLGRDDQAMVISSAIELEAEVQTQRRTQTARLSVAAMEQVGSELAKETDRVIAELMSGSSSTSTPASSESTPSD